MSSPRSVLGAATVGLALSVNNVVLLCYGLFIIPLSTAYGWTRGEISLGMTILAGCMAVFTPIMGAAFDKWGVRPILLPALVLLAIGVASLGLTEGRLQQFYGTLVALALLGSATSPSGYNRILLGWFDRRGLAFGIALSGIGIGGVLLPPFVQAAIARGGPALGYFLLGGLIAVIALPTVYFFLREKRDGQRAATDRAEPLTVLLGDARFWKLAIAFPLIGIFATGALLTLVPLLIDRGFEPQAAALSISIAAAAVVVGRIGVGYLLDRIPTWIVVGVFLAIPAAGIAGLALGLSGSAAYVCAALIGLGVGAEFDFLAYLASKHFSAAAFGRNVGLLLGITTAGAALGPAIMSRLFVEYGSYSAGLWVLAASLIASALLLMSLGPARSTALHQDHA